MHTEVDVKNPGLVLVPGMYASVVLTLAARANVLTVPVEGVDRNGDNSSVLVVDANQKVATRRITLGLETPTSAEVVSGLQEGDLVVLGNRAQLKAGTAVVPKLRAAGQQE
jgi:membrane fusion protein (multidrug efflux system)